MQSIQLFVEWCKSSQQKQEYVIVLKNALFLNKSSIISSFDPQSAERLSFGYNGLHHRSKLTESSMELSQVSRKL